MRILIAEDEPVSRLRLERMLGRWGYEVTAVSDGDEAWRALSTAGAPRLAILDWEMPGRDGVDLCRQLRKHDGARFTYLILLTARTEIEHLVEALNAGADDFLSKPFEPHELEARLRAGKRIVQLQWELIEAREALREQAMRDPLTGTWNRRAILAAFERELARVERRTGESGLGVVIADLDHFKRVNDSYGHLVGDEVLCEVVQRITQDLRRYDRMGRIGGEEFLILLPECGRREVRITVDRLRGVIADPIATAVGPLRLTLSLGAALVPDGLRTTARQILAAADQALYTAKASGRNRLCFAGDEVGTGSGGEVRRSLKLLSRSSSEVSDGS